MTTTFPSDFRPFNVGSATYDKPPVEGKTIGDPKRKPKSHAVRSRKQKIVGMLVTIANVVTSAMGIAVAAVAIVGNGAITRTFLAGLWTYVLLSLLIANPIAQGVWVALGVTSIVVGIGTLIRLLYIATL